MTTFIVRKSITVQLTSCLTWSDSTKHVNLFQMFTFVAAKQQNPKHTNWKSAIQQYFSL